MRRDFTGQEQAELLGKLQIVILGARLGFGGDGISDLDHDRQRQRVVEFQGAQIVGLGRVDFFHLGKRVTAGLERSSKGSELGENGVAQIAGHSRLPGIAGKRQGGILE